MNIIRKCYEEMLNREICDKYILSNLDPHWQLANKNGTEFVHFCEGSLSCEWDLLEDISNKIANTKEDFERAFRQYMQCGIFAKDSRIENEWFYYRAILEDSDHYLYCCEGCEEEVVVYKTLVKNPPEENK